MSLVDILPNACVLRLAQLSQNSEPERKITLAKACPKCGSLNVHRSRHRTSIERCVLRLFRSLPYRCNACRRRFYANSPTTRAKGQDVTTISETLPKSAETARQTNFISASIRIDV